ncbi:MAG TPA: carboxypeptidase-like regulatory domain-containing protein, partial [Agriterribacter sp.]|nr:carboxypeptidase-like regulatory domain-containing protein [Agriterribacter sp.]
LLNAADSSIITFTRTDKDGNFSLSELSPGTFSIMISYPSFADYVEEVELQPGAAASLGTISLTNKSVLLREI